MKTGEAKDSCSGSPRMAATSKSHKRPIVARALVWAALALLALGLAGPAPWAAPGAQATSINIWKHRYPFYGGYGGFGGYYPWGGYGYGGGYGYKSINIGGGGGGWGR